MSKVNDKEESIKFTNYFGQSLIKSCSVEIGGQCVQKIKFCKECSKPFEVDPYKNLRNLKYCQLCKLGINELFEPKKSKTT